MHASGLPRVVDISQRARGWISRGRLLLAPLFRCWLELATQDQRHWSYPVDTPTVAICGKSQVRVLIIGDAPAAGLGVRTHQLGVAGHLARRISWLVGCGAVVTVAAGPQASARSTLRTLNTLPIDGYDAIVLMLATTDSLRLTRPTNWACDMTRVALTISSRVNSELFITSSADLAAIEQLQPVRRLFAGGHARLLNAEAKQISEAVGCTFIELDSVTDIGSGTYEAWAKTIAARIAPTVARTPPPQLAKPIVPATIDYHTAGPWRHEFGQMGGDPGRPS
jgi:hypothetical protein